MRIQILVQAGWPSPSHLTGEPVSWWQSLKWFLALKFHHRGLGSCYHKVIPKSLKPIFSFSGHKAASDYNDHCTSLWLGPRIHRNRTSPLSPPWLISCLCTYSLLFVSEKQQSASPNNIKHKQLVPMKISQR